MCTSVVVGKNCSTEGVPFVARNEDYTRNNWNKYLVYRNEPEYAQLEAGQTWVLGNGLEIPAPTERFSYNAMPDAAAFDEASRNIGDRFYFEERGINERNFAVSATNSMTSNNLVIAIDPFVDIGICEAIIPTLLLPQCRNALDGVEMLGKYVSDYGASEPNGVLLADPDETWYLEIGSGHHWLAVKVPDDQYLIVANGLRIHDIDLKGDPSNIRCSMGLLSFVETNDLIKPPFEFDSQSFNFAAAFGVPGVPANVDREWLGQHILTPSLEQPIRQTQYPLFMIPDQNIPIETVMKILRAGYDGTPLEGRGQRPIGVERTAESHIITFRTELPGRMQGLIWQAIGTPLGAPYIPLFAAMTSIPESFSFGGNIYSPTSAYWAFRGTYALASSCSEAAVKTLVDHWHSLEQDLVAEQGEVYTSVQQLYEKDHELAARYAQRYSCGLCSQLVDSAIAKRNTLMTEVTEQQTQEDQILLNTAGTN